MVSTSGLSTSATKTYSPATSAAVGVAVGSVMTGLVPDRAATGTADMTLRINGVNLASVTGISFMPPDGITVQGGTLTTAADGSYADVHISVAENAPVSPRTVVVYTATGTVMAASKGANLFSVTYPQPEITAIDPLRKMIGSTFTLTVNGKNLFSASSIDFTPATGISVSNPPTVNADGTTATVTVVIAADAPAISRVVTATTPGGTTSGTASAANTFTVTADAGVTYSSLVSQIVGVLVTSTTATTQTASYNPVYSLAVGVATGPVITSVAPVSGAIGTSSLMVTVNGAGLVSAASMTFVPSTGITIQDGSFVAAADGSSASAVIDIAQDAPLTMKTVVLGGVAALPASPDADRFRVTLPTPELLGMQPIRKAVGSSFTLTVAGKNLSSASSIDFTPATGISVSNPPTVDADGTTATVTVVIAADAPATSRVVTITTPGGVTSSVASASNTFLVTADAGVTYASFASPAVGVLVTEPAAPTTQPVAYGPVLSPAVGIVVTPAAAPTSQNVSYGPVVSRPVGISVGASITGITPTTMEPGTTVDILIQGTGLDQVNSVQVQPSAGFTVGTVTPAPDGLSVTVSVTADASIAAGARTVIVSLPTGTVLPASGNANQLLAGPKPVINSIVPNLQTAGNTFTLTINGVHLQGATEVQFAPADGIVVNNPPAYLSDGTGEHLTVTVVISGTAIGGQRAVIVRTPYGSSDPTPSPANTMSIDVPLGLNMPVFGDEKPVFVRRTDAPGPRQESSAHLDPSNFCIASAVSPFGWEKKTAEKNDSSSSADLFVCISKADGGSFIKNELSGNYRFSGYRGPPVQLFA
jgi:hypothetical protein